MEPERQKASEKGNQAKDPHWNEKFQKGEGPFILCKDFFFFSVILNHSSPVKPNIHVTTTGILSEKLKATGENKGWIRRKQNCWRGRVQQCWVGLTAVWTEISGKLQLDILLFPFFCLFLILVWLLK